jgi:NosR/NirI family nitrous oxide reductase transcriptional regulator
MDDRPPDGPANQPVSKPRRRTWRQWFSSAVLPRGFRLALLAAVVYLLHIAAGPPSVERTVSLEHAKFFFPTATAFGTGDVRAGGQAVLDENGKLLGLLLTTSPHADDLIGYSGPSNLLIALDPQNQILGVQLLASGDTPSHVEQVRASPSFWQQFVGLDRSTRKEKVDAVSGSTLTSLAIAEAIDRRLHGSSVSLRFPEVVKLREIRKLFKAARKFEADTPRAGWYKAFDGEGNHIGYVVRTSPYSDNARGYQGPTARPCLMCWCGRVTTRPSTLIASRPTRSSARACRGGRSRSGPKSISRRKGSKEFRGRRRRALPLLTAYGDGSPRIRPSRSRKRSPSTGSRGYSR